MRNSVWIAVGFATIGLILRLAISSGTAAPAATQCDEAPIRYMNCDGDGKDCKLVARFRDVKACEDHLERQGWYCDTASTPGKAVCDTVPRKRGHLATGKCVAGN